MNKNYFFLIILFFLFFIPESKASHLLGSDITYSCIGNNQYLVTLTLYRDCAGIIAPGTQTLDYSSSCGNGTIALNRIDQNDITPLCPTETSSCSGGGTYGVQENIYQGTLTLPPNICNDWVLSWQECCRNDAINTLNGAGSQNMYNSTLLDNTLNPNCNSSPIFNNTPGSFVCINQPYTYNHGVSDIDGDSLYFSLGSCYQSSSSQVVYASGYSG